MGYVRDGHVNIPTVPEFYRGKTILITGGTGFMGKVLIEKLLWSCPDLERIYLLLRTKKGTAPEDRLPSIFSSLAFKRLHEHKPGVLEQKVFVIAGDVTETGLGISEEDRTLLINKVNIIFHVAASVRFDDPLKYAVIMNLRGSREIIELANEVRELAVLVHVSTSYSNTNRDPIEEKMYPPHADWRDTIDIVENTDDYTLKILTPKYLGELPNTYTFTKQLAEHVMYEQKGHLPIVIFRPSIVVSSVDEPFPGWIENFNGPVGLLVASGKGIMRSVYSDPDLIADYMPVDVAIKAMIVAGWKRGSEPVKPTDDLPIINCCTGKLKNITMRELLELGRDLAANIPLNNVLWYIGGGITTCKQWHYVKVLLLHLLPALFMDTILMLMGRKRMLVKLQRRIFIANLALDYYITRQWTFDNKNLISLRSSITEPDKKSFYFEIENVDIYTFFRNAVYGGRRYLLNEADDTLPQAFVHAKRMYVLDKVVQILFYGYLFWWIFNLSFVQNLGDFIYQLFVF